MNDFENACPDAATVHHDLKHKPSVLSNEKDLDLTVRQQTVLAILQRLSSERGTSNISTLYRDAVALQNQGGLAHLDSLLALLFTSLIKTMIDSYDIGKQSSIESSYDFKKLHKDWRACLNEPYSLFGKYNENAVKMYLDRSSEYFQLLEQKKENRKEQDKYFHILFNPKFVNFPEPLQEATISAFHICRQRFEAVKHLRPREDLESVIFDFEQILIDAHTNQTFGSEKEIDKLIMEVEGAE